MKSAAARGLRARLPVQTNATWSRSLRAAAWRATPEQDPEQQEADADEYDLQQGKPGERQRGTGTSLAADRGTRLCAGRRHRVATSRRRCDRRRRVLVLRCRPARPCLAGERAERCDQTDGNCNSEVTEAPSQQSLAAAIGR